MRHKISLASAPDSIGPALDELESCLIEDGVSTEHVLEVRLLGEEAITNVVKYAGAASMALEVQVTREEIVVVLRDDGKPFDPSSAKSPDLEASLADRALGGLGIHLIQSLSDAVSYAREEDRNVLRLTKKR